MAVGERKPARAIVIRSRGIDDGRRAWVKEAGVIHTVRMLIDKNPGFGRPGIGELARPRYVFVDPVPRTSFGIARPDADITGNASHPVAPTHLALDNGEKMICRAL